MAQFKDSSCALTHPRSNDHEVEERPSPTEVVEPDVWELDALYDQNLFGSTVI